MDSGVDIAELHVSELLELAVPEDEFLAYRERQRAGTQVDDLIVDYIRVEGTDRLSPKLIRKRVRTKVGEPLDLAVVRGDLERVYKIGEFENVGFSLERVGDRVGLVITATEKSWGPWYFQPGAAIRTDLDGQGEFLATGLLRRPHLNRLAAEWKSFVSLGSATTVFSEFFQPVEFTGKFFVAPSVLLLDGRSDTALLDGSQVRIDSRHELGSFDIGTLISNSGEIRLGVVGGKFTGDSDFFDDGSLDADLGAVRFHATLDRIDSATFPTDGAFAFLELIASQEGLGADDEFERLTVDLSYFGSVGRYTVGVTARGGSDLGSDLPFYADFDLGGFLNLSGIGRNELAGSQLAFGRLLVYRASGKLQSLLGGTKYVGISLETGNVWQNDQSQSISDLRVAGSLWVGMDSLLGPIYAGYGLADGGDGSFYLFLGRVFGPIRRF
jgi:NTE family protein